jgi:tRNA U34 5-methylaminomethyl-2-thiouridine-forming methyltransferase MnmC
MADLHIVETADGSSSVHSKRFNASYHSLHGALQESRHVFIQHGLNEFQSHTKIKLLEIGFGSGLNALLTWNWAEKNKLLVNYTGIEAYPLDTNILQDFKLGEEGTPEQFMRLHQHEWEVSSQLSPQFSFQKKNAHWPLVNLEHQVDLIFYDAFAPSCQPELWGNDALASCVDALRSGGIWVSYCAKGDVRRTLMELGCEVERLPGPPFKRHMLRARKR